MFTPTAMPTMMDKLPELTAFVIRLVDDWRGGTLTNWPDFAQRVRDFYTPAMMGKLEMVVPGWGKMASFANQQTLIHVTSVMTTLLLLPEYQQATAEQRIIMEWIGLFHDIAKEARQNDHDYTHGFRGAAVTGKALAGLGFPVNEVFAAEVDDWFALTHGATYFHEDYQEDIQDNRKLPEIIAGIERFYGVDTPATLVIKWVLLHLSIPSDPEYPTLAPLTDAQLHEYINAPMLPITIALALADDGAWNLFDAERTASQRLKTETFFYPLTPNTL